MPIILDGLQAYLHYTQKSPYEQTWKNIAPNAERNMDGTLYGTTLDENGIVLFDGVDDYLRVSAPVTSFPGTEWTMDFVVKIESNPGTLLRYKINSLYVDYPGMGAGFFFGGSGQNLRFVPCPLPSDEFVHIALTKDASNVVQIFVNGQKVEETPVPIISSSDTFIYVLGGQVGYLKGALAFFRAYNRILTPAEIAHNYGYWMDVGLDEDEPEPEPEPEPVELSGTITTSVLISANLSITQAPTVVPLGGQVNVATSTTGSLNRRRTFEGEAAAGVTMGATGLRRRRTFEGTLHAQSMAAAKVTRRRTLSGHGAAQTDISGILRTARRLGDGHIILINSHAIGTLSAHVPIQGTVTNETDLTAGLRAHRSLTGAALAQSHVEGTLTEKSAVPLEASAQVSTSLAGALDRARTLTGDMEASPLVSGTLDRRRTFEGAAHAIVEAYGSISMQGQERLDGEMTVTVTINGVLRLEKSLSGESKAISTTAGTLMAHVPLLGAVETVGEVLGNLRAKTPLTGEIHASSDMSGSLKVSADADLASSVHVQSTVEGTLHARVPLMGAIFTEVIVASANLQARVPLNGRIDVITTVYADIGGRSRTWLGGSVNTAVAVEGSLRVQYELWGNSQSFIDTAGTLAADVPLRAISTARTDVYGSLSTESRQHRDVPLRSFTIRSESKVAGSLDRLRKLIGNVGADVQTTGLLGRTHALAGEVTFTSDATASIRRVRGLDGSILSTSEVQVLLAVFRSLDGDGLMISDASGDLSTVRRFEGTAAIEVDVEADLLRERMVPIIGTLTATVTEEANLSAELLRPVAVIRIGGTKRLLTPLDGEWKLLERMGATKRLLVQLTGKKEG